MHAIKVIACVVLLGSALAAQAQNTSLQPYDVELILFRVVNPNATQEDWALEEALAKSSAIVANDAEEAIATAVPPVAATAIESNMQPLEAGRFKLTAQEASLKRSRNYEVLAHIGWTQPGFSLDSPRPLAIENLLPAGTGVTGTVTLTRGKYLHLVLDLTLRTADGKAYVLREHRRMKSNDKHYLDHPYFGVITLITPKNPP